MKKLTALLLTASVILSLASCGGTESASTTTSGSTTTTTAATEGTTTPETTTTEETTTTPETTTSDEGTTTTPETSTTSAETTTTVPDTSASTTTTKVTTTAPTTTTTKPVTTTKATTTTTKPVTTTAPKTEATTTTTAAPTYDHCEGFNKIWGENGAPYYDTMTQYGDAEGGGDSIKSTMAFRFNKKTAYVFGMKIDWVSFDRYLDFETVNTDKKNYCRSAAIIVNKTESGDAITVEIAKDMLEDFYGPCEEKDGRYYWYNTADGDIELYKSSNYPASGIWIEFSQAGWELVIPDDFVF